MSGRVCRVWRWDRGEVREGEVSGEAMSTVAGRPIRVALSGGGSGGHVYPALAVAARLQEGPSPAEVTYLGVASGLEADLVPRAGVPFAPIHAAAWLKPGLVAKVMGAWHTGRGTWDAWRLLSRVRPDVVLTTGGYVTGPVGLAASWLKIPLLVHEQNVWPGLTNRLLARRAQLVLTTYAETARHLPDGIPVRVSGYPVRPSVAEAQREEARRQLGLSVEWVVVAATGGSQGAPAVNALMRGLWPLALAQPNWSVVWATGPRRFDAAVAGLDRDASDRLRVTPYLYDLDVVLAAADVVVGRAGAGTLAEAAARALPLVLVPSPHVSEHHQEKNAAAWSERGAALIVPESEASRTGPAVVAALMDDERARRTMGGRAHEMHHAAALDRIAAAVREAAARGGRG